ncbi:sensor histidine kinase [Puia dinghuensis]|uniref:Histidine kinase domain-containing protein n=1 Tax=Puia dinghuensis TaxID=1792502 RepID=A0A8J2XRG6_9BACT|nr:ATP-binding protein [Puia dinghuensis]GGA86827.1 hypothetical protein GCM10011511_07370 [Puia dinghuensis]
MFIRFLFFILLSLAVIPVLSQPDVVDGYSVQHFTDENGLPQNSINDLLFDKDGYLWLATQVGLVRFNGSAFKLFYPDDKPLLESNVVYLGKNDEGVIYFQTVDRNLYRYAGNNSQFLSPVNSPATQRPLLLNAQKQVFDFTRFLQDARPAGETLRRRSLFQQLFAHPENFFVADSDRVYLIDEDSLYYYDGSLLHLLSASEGRAAQCLLYDRRLYVLHHDSVTAVYDNGNKIHGPARIEGDKIEGKAIMRDPDPAVYAARLFSCGRMNHLLVDHRLYRLSPEPNGHIRAKLLVNLDFISNISSIEYNSGLDLLLISTDTEGFYFLRRNHFRISGWPVEMQHQLSRHLFGPMALHDDREIFTDKFIFTPAGAWSPVQRSGLTGQHCLFIDKKETIWTARNDTPWKLTTAMVPVATMPPLDAGIVDYAEDDNGSLYCLTKRSLWRLESGIFRRLYTSASQDSQRHNEAMAFAGGHRLYIGTTNGLIGYDPAINEAYVIPELSGAHVRAIHRCRDGSILVGTYGEGYYYFFNGRFYRMPMDKNGFLITAHCFLEDRRGYIWIPCNKGLFKVPKADMEAWCKGENDQLFYYYYGRQDGLQTNEFNGGFNACGVITSEGFVSLLSMKGMVCFYTDSLQTDFPHGAIDMADLEIDGKSAPRTDTIGLSAGYNSLVLAISSPYLGNRNNLYLQYHLSGFNDEWKQLPEDGTLNLSRLAPGNYTLRVRQVNGFGKNNYQYRQWSIVVPPYFYRTTWFLSLVGLVVLVLLILLVQLRIKLVEKKQKLQHSEQALLKTNRQREKLISLVIHDLRSPLRFLTTLAGDLHDNQASLSTEDVKDRTYWIKKGAQDVYHFSEDFLLWVTSQKDNFNLRNQLFFVRPLLQEVYDFYLEQVLQKGNRLTYEADEQLQLYSDPHLVLTIIRNLTDNANKYTSQGEIRITARQERDDVLILVADTGLGMSPQQAAAFMGESNLDNVKSGSQLGHQFIVDLTRRLNGTLFVETGEKTGTTVTLRIPIGLPADATVS